MGSNYSDLNLYFYGKEEKRTKDKYTVTTTKGYFKECINFIKITYTITFTPPENGTHYNTVIYDGYDDKTQGRNMFGYYYPSNPNEVIQEVYIYCSIFAPNVPLVISFVRPGNTYNCLYEKLHGAGWDHAYNITYYSSGEELKQLLPDQYKKLYSEKTIEFKIGSEKKEISERTNDFGQNVKRYIFIPNGNAPEFGNQNLFKNITTFSGKNQLDPSYLSSVKNDYFDGILVYTKDNIAVLIEFFRKCTTKHIKREDKDGTYWVEQLFNYTDDKSLISSIDQIKNSADQNVIETYMLDKFSKYNEVNVTPEKSKNTYNKYSHKPSQSRNPNLLFKVKKITINKYQTTTPISGLVIYYLTVKGGKEKNQDDNPFLIVLDENGTEPKTQKIYHFNNKNEFKDWAEFTTNDLDKRLTTLETNGGCIGDLTTLRKFAYEVLTKDKPPDPPEPTPVPKPPDRPQLEIPPTHVQETDWNLFIILIVTGVVVLGLIAATIYGIYWYNTTIKLLT